jgi:transcriptional regulator with XRE-family HTH domain
VISGALLREARLRAGFSQAELARRAGKPTSTIGRWERGEVLPSLETLRAVVRACDLELTFRLANAGRDEHDGVLIERALAQSPAERVAAAADAANAVERLVSARRRV